MNIKNTLCVGLLLTSTQFVFAESQPITTAGNILSDRASYDKDTQKLHIPYVTTNFASGLKASADLSLSPTTDSQGRALFSLDLSKGLHTLEKPHFDYTGDQGPEFWAKLTTDYKTCGIGKNQSPINLINTADDEHKAIGVDLTDITFKYASTALNIENNGHTVEVVYNKGSSISLRGKTYNLLQFHFHTPSEHTINGQNVPMEMHLVHKSEDGALAVVGVLITAGAENAAFKDVVDHIPAEKKEVETIANKTVDANKLLPSEILEYRYSGSLTTPPCSEGVQWLVLKKSVEMSQAQIDAFIKAMGSNNRPIQAINARDVLSNL